MTKKLMNLLRCALTIALLTAVVGNAYAEVGPVDLEGEDKAMFDRFRDLFQNGSSKEFYDFAKTYEKDLKSKGYMMLYYKLLNNEGFFALHHNMIFLAMQTAERLNDELHADKAHDYYYLATGLMGDIYYANHNRKKAEAYFKQALEEVDDSDPKFTMRTYHSLAEMICLYSPQNAMEWLDKAKALAIKTDNVEYQSLSVSMTAYLYFLMCDSEQFDLYYKEYQHLRSMNKPGFSLRYANVLDVARLAFEGRYQDASYQLANSGTIYVDSSLVAIRIFAMARDIDKGFEAVKRRRLELDSIYSLAQDANFDQMATERSLLMSKEEALANKKQAKKLTNWLIVLVIVFLFVYLMGRRRLMRKIWAKNRSLKEALAKAAESDQMKKMFISNMSHEIRTPLNAVVGFSQVICNPEYDLSEEDKKDMEGRILSNVHLITSIFNEVLELSNSESEGSLVADADKVDVKCNDLARTVLHDAEGRQRGDVELRFASNVEDDFAIRSNLYRLKSAMTHLVDNAVKFTDTGYVEMRCEKRDDKMLFFVTDTGVGIKEADKERIFETFSKIDDFKEGIGLGLPICRRLIRSLGGEVELDTTYSGGCRFVISLPM
ncbi:MAG: HAMP domain-containing histidine kinase [Prevotella sp.]|nr:HAMP domain-containing histidine kinase [Prevotella sp.]